jgi:hypothetical protein
MAVKAYDHTFTAYGAEEMICRACGYVIWSCLTTEKAEDAIRKISGQRVYCGGAWHVFRREPLDD